MTAVERLLDRLEGVRSTGHGRWQAQCPAHDDRTPSLALAESRDGAALIKCFAGCPTEDVLAAIGMGTGELFEEPRRGSREIVDTYPYVDEQGVLLSEVVRYAPKDFRQRRPDGSGGWSWKLTGVRRVLYRLPRVLATAARGHGVFVVEGEKDVHALERLGQVATCNPGGAGKWRPEYGEDLRGAEVVVVADRDEAGREHARQLAESLRGVAASVDVVEPRSGKDIFDHLGPVGLQGGGSVMSVADVGAIV